VVLQLELGDTLREGGGRIKCHDDAIKDDTKRRQLTSRKNLSQKGYGSVKEMIIGGRIYFKLGMVQIAIRAC
jgi:hypothetical protein